MKMIAWMHLILLGLSTAQAGPTDYYILQRNTVSQNSFFRASTINLMSWVRAGRPLPDPSQPYDREKHFGRWIDDRRDNNCLNTRGKILMSSTQAAVTYTNSFKCVIATGLWTDPYTNLKFTSAKDIQIDHLVPLKQAYTTGAWKWDSHARCLYGNFLFNKFHLIAASGHENMSKSDKAPDQYMPPNKQIWCPYIQSWLKVKLIWNLVMTPTEAAAIAKIFTQASCKPQDFTMPESELAEQRKLIQQNYNYCDNDAPRPLSRVNPQYD